MHIPGWLSKVLLGSLLLTALAFGFADTHTTDDTLLAGTRPSGSLAQGGGN